MSHNQDFKKQRCPGCARPFISGAKLTTQAHVSGVAK